MGGMDWEIGTDMCTVLYIGYITNKSLLCSTGNSTQYSVVAYMGKESLKKVDMCMCVADLLCCIPETNAAL